MASIQGKVASGAAWMTTTMVLERTIGFISTLVLARLLSPADFGVVAMCMSVVAVLELFLAFGFDVVLIQRQDLATRDHYDTVWTIRLLISVLVALAIFAGAYPAGAYYSEKSIVAPMQILAFTTLIRSLESIRIIDLRKEFEFRKEAAYRLAQKTFGFCITIPTALYLQSYWALVIGIVSTAIIAVVLSYLLKPTMPRLTLKEYREVFGFSVWLLMANIVTTARSRLSHFLLGRSGGANDLGIFQISQEMSSDLSTQMVASVNRAVFPGYARMAGNVETFREFYLRVSSVAALIAMPVGLGIVVIAPLAVPIVLGPQWVAATVPVQLFAINGIFLAMSSNANYVFLARGEPKVITVLTTAQIVLLAPLLWALIAAHGLSGAIAALLVVSSLTLAALTWLVCRRLSLGIGDIVKTIWRPLVSAVLMACVVGAYMESHMSITPTNLLITLTLGIVIYVLSLAALVGLSERSHSVEALLIRHVISMRST